MLNFYILDDTHAENIKSLKTELENEKRVESQLEEELAEIKQKTRQIEIQLSDTVRAEKSINLTIERNGQGSHSHLQTFETPDK